MKKVPHDRRGNFKHGESGGKGVSPTPEYVAWRAMICRCELPTSASWSRYGGRGIRVCERWRNNYELFLADVGRRPSTGHSLDRFPDPDGNYKPGNVRWATAAEQQRNRRDSQQLTFMGETLTVREWGYKLGIKFQTIVTRVARDWSVERTLSEPVHYKRKRRSG
jgi:hypothetical protein